MSLITAVRIHNGSIAKSYTDFYEDEVFDIDYVELETDSIFLSQNHKPLIVRQSKHVSHDGNLVGATTLAIARIQIEIRYVFGDTINKVNAVYNYSSSFLSLFASFNDPSPYEDKYYYYCLLDPNHVESYLWGEGYDLNIKTKLIFYPYQSQTVA